VCDRSHRVCGKRKRIEAPRRGRSALKLMSLRRADEWKGMHMWRGHSRDEELRAVHVAIRVGHAEVPG
jgi:hypothetical protein